MAKIKAQFGQCKKCKNQCLLLAGNGGLCVPCKNYTPAQKRLNQYLVNAKNKNIVNIRKAAGH